MEYNSKKFFFIRHGESLWNIKNLCQGQKDIELSENGIREAEVFAAKFANFSIGHICTSPLIRALKTAEIIKQHHPKAGFSLIKEFSERNWGDLEGISSQAMYQVEKLEEEDPHYRLDPSVESRQDLKLRIARGLQIAFEFHPEPLIVSHGRLFLSLCELLDIPIIRQINNLDLIEFSHKADRWHLRRINLD